MSPIPKKCVTFVEIIMLIKGTAIITIGIRWIVISRHDFFDIRTDLGLPVIICVLNSVKF